ncbi:hypothetical protein ILYODFUR_035724 [Ilyodon furcidens]|uniref:Uncharacterized protein n=1 Tax=Ilyodon furcidens TaxID=33524 RepID=A0ABV0T2Y4_9TELE
MDDDGGNIDYFFHNDSDIYEPHNKFNHYQVYAVVFLNIIFLISMPGISFLLWVLLKERAWRTLLTCYFCSSQLQTSASLRLFSCCVQHTRNESSEDFAFLD